MGSKKRMRINRRRLYMLILFIWALSASIALYSSSNNACPSSSPSPSPSPFSLPPNTSEVAGSEKRGKGVLDLPDLKNAPTLWRPDDAPAPRETEAEGVVIPEELFPRREPATSSPPKKEGGVQGHVVASPLGTHELAVRLSSGRGCVEYSILRKGDWVAAWAPLSLSLNQIKSDLCEFKVLETSRRSFSETWKPLYGQRSSIPNSFNELILHLGREAGGPSPLMTLELRAFEEGVAFRLNFPSPASSPLFPGISRLSRDLPKLEISAKVNLTFGRDGTIFRDLSGENGFEANRLSSKSGRGWPWDLPMHPFTVQYDDGGDADNVIDDASRSRGPGGSTPVVFALTEARNLEYETLRFAAGATFGDVTATFRRQAEVTQAPLETPFFCFLIGGRAGELVEGSYLVENLNDPCEIEDPSSWIKVGKVFRDLALSTQSSRASIDMAVKLNLQHLLLDASWYGPETLASSDATTWLEIPKKAPLDLPEVIAYGREKGVGVWLYVNDIALKRQIDDIIPLYSRWGVAGIKFGFVQLDSSRDTSRLLGYIRRCAEYKLMVNIHDNFRPSGYSRTYPNFVSIEGIRGDEHKERPKHALMLPFVRYLAGFADNTFVFDVERLTEMRKSISHQIALSIIYYNPLSHLYWYRDPWSILKLHKKLSPTLQHLRVWIDMPTTWEETRVLTAQIGNYISLARKDALGNWFLASATYQEQRLSLKLDFLEEGEEYEVQRFTDDPDTLHSGGKYQTFKAKKGENYEVEMFGGGGDVAVFKIPGSPSPSDLERTGSSLSLKEQGIFETKSEALLPWQTLKKIRLPAPIFPLNVLYKSTGPYDSKVFLFNNDTREYRVCTLFNVCFNSDQLFLLVEDDAQRDQFNSDSELCQQNHPNKPSFCRCFARSLKPVFIKDFMEVAPYRVARGHTWVSDNWVKIHQIAHWIEKSVQFHSISLKADDYNFTTFERFAFIKSPPMDPTEKLFYDLSTSLLPYQIPESPLFRDAVENQPLCAEKISMSALSATMATSEHDMMEFRKTANRILETNLRIPKEGEKVCPSKKTILLYRSEPLNRLRKMLNQEEVEDLLKRLGIVDFSVETTNSKTPAMDQINFFGDFGLMVAPHTSQLVFSIFSQPNAAIVEAAPTYFNSDFAGLAEKAGLFYRFALGGTTQSTDPDVSPERCNSKFDDCDGVPSCIEKNTVCNKIERGALKEGNFEVDLEVLERMVKQAIDHLNQACGGAWPGVRQRK